MTDDRGMSDDATAPDELTYTLIVKAESDREALEAFDSNASIATRRLSVRAVPGHPERVLTFEPDFGDGSKWGHDFDLFRSPVEQRLNEWFVRDVHDCREGLGYPMGSLLWWGRRSSREA